MAIGVEQEGQAMTQLEQMAVEWFQDLQRMRDRAAKILATEPPDGDTERLLKFRRALGHAQSSLIKPCGRVAPAGPYPP